MDVFCAAAKLGDRTQGAPGAVVGTLAERVTCVEATVRARVTLDCYSGEAPQDDAWQTMQEPWRTNHRWRRIQPLTEANEEAEALEHLTAYLADLSPEARGAGYGAELVLALDLALRARSGQVDAEIAEWIERHGHRFESEPFLLETALSFPSVASATTGGLLHGTIGLRETELDAALNAIDAALASAMKAAAKPTTVTPRIQKRRVSAEYSQVHLAPSDPTAAEAELVHFQEPGDSERGMSLFETMVAIGTPPDTDYVDAVVSIARDEAPDPALAGVVQAVSFPIVVRGPLILRSATSFDGEPLLVPPGTYDVLARFKPKKSSRASYAAGLRVFELLLSFHTAKSLGAPKTLLMEAPP